MIIYALTNMRVFFSWWTVTQSQQSKRKMSMLHSKTMKKSTPLKMNHCSRRRWKSSESRYLNLKVILQACRHKIVANGMISSCRRALVSFNDCRNNRILVTHQHVLNGINYNVVLLQARSNVGTKKNVNC